MTNYQFPMTIQIPNSKFQFWSLVIGHFPWSLAIGYWKLLYASPFKNLLISSFLLNFS